MSKRVYTVGDCTKIQFVRVEKTDLWRDEVGYSGNYCWVKRALFPIPENISDGALSRRILASVDSSNCGFKVGGWLGSQLDWRAGLVGICADIDTPTPKPTRKELLQKIYDKGYRWEIQFPDNTTPLCVKTIDDIARTMREDFPAVSGWKAVEIAKILEIRS